MSFEWLIMIQGMFQRVKIRDSVTYLGTQQSSESAAIEFWPPCGGMGGFLPFCLEKRNDWRITCKVGGGEVWEIYCTDERGKEKLWNACTTFWEIDKWNRVLAELMSVELISRLISRVNFHPPEWCFEVGFGDFWGQSAQAIETTGCQQ